MIIERRDLEELYVRVNKEVFRSINLLDDLKKIIGYYKETDKIELINLVRYVSVLERVVSLSLISLDDIGKEYVKDGKKRVKVFKDVTEIEYEIADSNYKIMNQMVNVVQSYIDKDIKDVKEGKGKDISEISKILNKI